LLQGKKLYAQRQGVGKVGNSFRFSDLSALTLSQIEKYP